VKDLGGGRPRYLKKRDLKKLRRESTGNVNETLRMTTGLEIAKRIARSTVGLRKMRNWTLWRGRFPPERINETEQGGRKARRHKQRPRKGRKGDTPLGYSGRIVLRREQCDI
jgi:hypothetical protein